MMIPIRKITFYILIFFAVNAIASQGWVSLSLIQLISNPERYNGNQIVVSGYLHHRKDSSALFLSKSDGGYLIKKNAINIVYGKKVTLNPIPEFKNSPDLSLVHFDSKIVRIYGTFSSKSISGTEKYSGTLYDVNKVEEIHRVYSGRAALKRHNN